MRSPVSWPAKVVKVLADDRVIINRGEDAGLTKGARVLLYMLDSEDIVDPDTREVLGRLEMSKGNGVITHVQDRISVVYNTESYFENPRVGDLAKPF